MIRMYFPERSSTAHSGISTEKKRFYTLQMNPLQKDRTTLLTFKNNNY